MPAAAPESEHFMMLCTSCQRPVRTFRNWAGREVRCPYCSATLRVPEPPDDGRIVRAVLPRVGARRIFYFPCPRCQAMLEAHTGLCGGTGRCPGCGARLRIPLIRRSGRPTRAELLDAPDDEPDAAPAPLHAFAADGAAAPRIAEIGGVQRIVCPRCEGLSPIDADACACCGLPFTMEAAGTVGSVRAARHGAGAWLTGVVGLLLFPLVLPALLALYFATRALLEPDARRPVGAWVGAALGCLGLIAGMVFWYQILH